MRLFGMKNILNMFSVIRDLRRRDHSPAYEAPDIFKYIGPGLLVTVVFIDPGNWAANIATGSDFGYALLWIVTYLNIKLLMSLF